MRMGWRQALAVALSCGMALGAAFAQSLGEAAREKEKKKGGKGAKVLTEDDLRKAKGSGGEFTGAPVEESPAPSPATLSPQAEEAAAPFREWSGRILRSSSERESAAAAARTLVSAQVLNGLPRAQVEQLLGGPGTCPPLQGVESKDACWAVGRLPEGERGQNWLVVGFTKDGLCDRAEVMLVP